MEKVKKQLHNIKNGFLDGLPVIIVALIMFFSFLNIFGVSEVLITPFLAILFRTKSREEFNLKKLLKIFCMLMFISIFSFVANLSLALCIVMNLLVPSLIVYLYTNSFTPRGYFVYVMAFVFLQLRPIPYSALPNRFMALSYGMLVTVALFIYSLKQKKKNSYELAQLGLLNLYSQINKLSKKESFKSDIEGLNRIIKLIYEIQQISYIIIHRDGVHQVEKNITEVLDNIDVVLNRIQATLESNELTLTQIASNKSKDYGKISEDIYFNSIVVNCMRTVDTMSDLVNERYLDIGNDMKVEVN